MLRNGAMLSSILKTNEKIQLGDSTFQFGCSKVESHLACLISNRCFNNYQTLQFQTEFDIFDCLYCSFFFSETFDCVSFSYSFFSSSTLIRKKNHFWISKLTVLWNFSAIGCKLSGNVRFVFSFFFPPSRREWDVEAGYAGMTAGRVHRNNLY